MKKSSDESIYKKTYHAFIVCMVKLHSRILICFILGIAMNIWVLTMLLKEITMYLKGMAMSFQMTSAFVGGVSDVAGDTKIPKICLRAKNE